MIIFGSVCLSIIVLCFIFVLVFRLKTVDIEFRSREEKTNLAAETPTRVLETGEFDFGKNILFMNFDDNIAKIEKSNPFVKVEQVIRHFPNTVRVYISERQPRYRVQDEIETNKWYILDSEFKVLDKVNEEELLTKKVCGESNYYSQTIEITKTTLTFKTAIVGEFARVDISAYLSDIVSGIYGKTKDHTQIRSIDYSEIAGKFTLVMRNTGLENQEGCKIVLEGTDDLYQKSLAGAVVYVDGQVVENVTQRIENTPDVTVEILKNDDGYYGLVV